MAGFVDSSGTVKDCLSFATVTNNGNPNYQYVGGMVGYNKGSIIGCTSLGTVTGSSKAGDFIVKYTKEAMEEAIMPIFKGKVKILLSTMKDADAAVLGASALAWQ